MEEKVGFFKSIQVKLVIIFVLLILISMQIIGVYFTKQLEEQLLTNYFQLIDERANLLAYNIEQEMERSRGVDSSLRREIDLLLREFFAIDNSEVQVIDANKIVLSTSNYQDRNIVGQQSTEVRVKRALRGTKDEDVLRDPQTGHRVRVLSVPVSSGDEIIGAIYIEASMEEIYDQIQQINNILSSGTIISLAITVLLVILLARTITGPIIEMRKQTKAMAAGDFSRNVHVYSTDEIGQLAMSFNDLTLKLKEANATTEGERKKLSSVLTHMTDGVIATDDQGKIILMNRRAEDLLAVSAEQVLDIPLSTLLQLSEDTTVADLSHRAEAILLDFSNEARDYLLEASFSVIQKENGPVSGLITVLHDVTEQEKVEQERREFVANVSHELRTPLTTLKSYLEALEDGALNDPDIAPKFLKVTQNETERMIRLVNDLLQLSKIDSKDYQFSFKALDLAEFLHSMIDRFEMISKQQQINFVRQLGKDSVIVKADRDKLTQVVDNIISNAIKYSPAGGTITIDLQHEGNNVRISISDKGVGIPKENQAKIFDRFYRVDKARARNLGGTGLGLAIAKEMVHVHGGEIGVQSDDGQGTRVFFTLPYSATTGGVDT